MRNYLKKLSTLRLRPAPDGAGLRSGQALNFQFSTSGGQSLVEVLVSLTVAAAVLSAITVGVIYSLRNSQFAKNQNLASHYAAQGMEIIRQIRDDKSTLSSYTNISYCLGQDSISLSIPPVAGCGQNVGQKDIGPNPQPIYIYSRKVRIDQPNPLVEENKCEKKNYKVSVIVSWWDNVCGNTSNFCHKVNLISCLSDRKKALKP